MEKSVHDSNPLPKEISYPRPHIPYKRTSLGFSVVQNNWLNKTK